MISELNEINQNWWLNFWNLKSEDWKCWKITILPKVCTVQFVTVVILHMWSDFFPPKKEMIKIKTHDIKPHVLCLNNLQLYHSI